MTPILTAANMIDGTNSVKSKSTQKSELNQAFGQEFSRALANTKSQKQNADATRSAPNNTNATNKAQTYRNNQEGTPSAGKLRDNDVQISPLKPDTEKSEVTSTGKPAADTNDTSLPVRKRMTTKLPHPATSAQCYWRCSGCTPIRLSRHPEMKQKTILIRELR
jgi:hypothetical protein